jgi:hypothetical protein
VVVKKGEFTDEEIGKLDDFSARNSFAFVYHPRRDLGNIVETFVRTNEKEAFIRDFPRNISPTSDDQPYFFNYTKWSDLLSAREHTDETSAVSQGNPIFIFSQLVFSAILALLFILLPVVIFMRRGLERGFVGRSLVYFSGLGLGFIAIEIALMQKLVLFLGHPLYSITVTLFSMLVFAGIGSIISQRWFESSGRRSWLIPLGLAACIGLFVLFSPAMVNAWIVWSQMARILICIAVLAPISLLLGVPFAYGIRMLNRVNPSIIPWAWAVNGCMTVIGSVLTVIVSMNFGFNAVMLAAVAVYWISFLTVLRVG